MNTASRFRSRMGFPGNGLGVMAGSAPLGGYAPASGGFTGDGIGGLGGGAGGGLAALAGIGGVTPSAPRAPSVGGAAAPTLSGSQTVGPLGFPTDGNPSEPFNNPNVTYGGWMATAAPWAASLIGGPFAGTVFGGLMGGQMAQEIQDTYGRAGLAPVGGMPGMLGGVVSGASRGISGMLGLTPSLQDMLTAYAAVPSVQQATDWGGVLSAIANNPAALPGYTVAGVAPEDLGNMGGGQQGAPDGWGGGYGNPGAGDASFGMGETGSPDFGGAGGF